MEPLAQFFHLSDVHCGPLDRHANVTVRSRIRRALAVFGAATGLRDRIIRGVASHDPSAWKALRRSVRREHIQDKWETNGVVVTGDLSTWGDDHSVLQATALVRAICTDIAATSFVIYGNHDVWIGRPGRFDGFPLFCSNRELDLRRTNLHQLPEFSHPCPRQIPVARLPDGRPLNVTLVNTVEHGRIFNAFARGSVDADRYWEQVPGTHQLDAMLATQGASQVSIVLTHHPICDPSPDHAIGLLNPVKLQDPDIVADALHQGRHDQALVVLSGHTHQTFPPIGASTGAGPAPTHDPLGSEQIQLTAGTASQLQFGAERTPHVWQQLLFYADKRRLRVERTVYARSFIAGEYEAVPADDNDPTSTTDAYELRLV